MKLLLISLLAFTATAQELTELPRYTTVTRSSPRVFERDAKMAPPPVTEVLKIAIIDSGFRSMWATSDVKLCKEGHYNFITDEPVVGPALIPHGTQVASIVAEELKGKNYCLLIYNVFTDSGISFENIEKAFAKAKDAGAKLINMSIQGYQSSFTERDAILKVAQAGVKVFVAAGNDNIDLDESCNSYPGCYKIPGLYMVGSIQPDYSGRSQFSNYGARVDLWYPGYYDTPTANARGTSYASPRAVADYARLLLQRR